MHCTNVITPSMTSEMYLRHGPIGTVRPSILTIAVVGVQRMVFIHPRTLTIDVITVLTGQPQDNCVQSGSSLQQLRLLACTDGGICNKGSIN